MKNETEILLLIKLIVIQNLKEAGNITFKILLAINTSNSRGPSIKYVMIEGRGSEKVTVCDREHVSSHFKQKFHTYVSHPSFLMVDFSTVLSLDRLPPMSFPLDS